MNRIREFNNKYQVLVTPSMDFLIGRWMDPFPHNLRVETYDYFEDAQARAMDLPDINWSRLVEIHEYEYKRIANEIKHILDLNLFAVEYHPILKNEKRLKNKFFELVSRAQEEGQEFIMMEKLTDVICIEICNPWSKNLQEIKKVLETQKSLKIYNSFSVKDKIIHMQGVTIMDTPFEIQLWPSVMYNWKQWNDKNVIKFKSDGFVKTSRNKFDQCLKIQKQIDSINFRVR